MHASQAPPTELHPSSPFVSLENTLVNTYPERRGDRSGQLSHPTPSVQGQLLGQPLSDW